MATLVQHPHVPRERPRPAAPPDTRTALTRDGAPLQLRPARPDDRQAIEALFARLSPRSLRQRFLAASAISARDYVADLADQERTLDAVLVTWRGAVVAVGSTHRVSQTAAEIAFAIDDAHQGQGLGTLMLEDLAARARAAGLQELVALTLASNTQMLRVFADVGLPTHVEPAGETCTVTIQLDDEADLERATARRTALAAVASLQRFLRPRSVAVVGAGVHRDGVGRQVVERLQRSDFPGHVYAVNSSGRAIGWTASFRTVAEVPEAVDLAVIAVSGEAVTAAVREATAAGARAIVVLGAGPSTAGPALTEAEDVRSVCRSAGVRFLGPDSIGVVNTDPRVRLDASFLQPPPTPGPVCVVADSWAVTTSIVSQLGMRGTGVSTVVNLGTAGEVSAADVLSFAATDPRTSLAVVCVEDEEALAACGPLARPAGGGALPVLLLSTGEATAMLSGRAEHHVGSAGVVRVGSLAELIDTADVLAKAARPRGRRVAVVANSGASGRLTLKALPRHGLVPAALTHHADLRLRSVLPPGASASPVVDATSAATLEQLRVALTTVAEDPGVDAVVAQITALPHLPACEIGHLLDEVAQANPATSMVSAVQDSICTGPQHVPTTADPHRAVLALAHAWEVGRR